MERGEGLLKGARESNGTVIKQAADLNASINAGTLFLGVPAIAIGANIDARPAESLQDIKDQDLPELSVI